MSPATWPREDPENERLLLIDTPSETYGDARVRDLSSRLRAGDLLVVNDAATLPASLHARDAAGRALEVRLASGDHNGQFRAILFGEGDWRTPTEDRALPAPFQVGDVIEFVGRRGPEPRSEASIFRLRATIEGVTPGAPRLVELRFDREGDLLWSALYEAGRPVQYAYLKGPLDLWHVQTRYASRPWAVEPPSGGRPLTWSLLLDLIRRGVRIAPLTHAAGLSSTGDPELDALLPLPERYEIPAETAAAVRETRAAGGRVIAVGTTVVRALEGCAAKHGEVVAGPGETDLRIGPSYRLRVVRGILTGLHEPTASHFHLLQAFAPKGLIHEAYTHAQAAGYLCHEFGDSNLILAA
jgi:S-adenosylmethionine:tRNA ribosyltransferase-isomerase